MADTMRAAAAARYGQHAGRCPGYAAHTPGLYYFAAAYCSAIAAAGLPYALKGIGGPQKIIRHFTKMLFGIIKPPKI